MQLVRSAICEPIFPLPIQKARRKIQVAETFETEDRPEKNTFDVRRCVFNGWRSCEFFVQSDLHKHRPAPDETRPHKHASSCTTGQAQTKWITGFRKEQYGGIPGETNNWGGCEQRRRKPERIGDESSLTKCITGLWTSRRAMHRYSVGVCLRWWDYTKTLREIPVVHRKRGGGIVVEKDNNSLHN